jgi:hypothetical protein
MSQIVQETVSTSESPEAAEPKALARYRRAQERVRAVRGFYIHLGVYLIVNTGIFLLNWVLRVVNGPSQNWFFYWVLLGWGIGVLINGFVVFGPDRFLGHEWEERKIREYMAKEE